MASLLVFGAAASAWAAKPSDSLLPASTKGYVSVPSMARLRDEFNRSQLGRLANDPAMAPFVDDFKRQLRQQGLKQLEQLGLTFDELDGLPTGEVALAAVQLSTDEAAVALVVDVTGHGPQAQALLTKVGARLTQNGAKLTARTAGDRMIVYQFPAEPGRRVGPTAAYLLDHDMLIASDSAPVVEGMAKALAVSRNDSLAEVPAYREIMARCATASAGLQPDMRWFIEPFGYAETVRAVAPLRDKRKGPDLLKVFKSQGFTAVQGLGGFVNFSAGKYELLHRTVVYAPPAAGRKPGEQDKYTLAARMLKFPAGGNLMPEAWVPRDVATYSTFNFDIQNAFRSADSLIDELVGQKGVFHDVLDSLRDDPDGPKVDIEKQLIAHLGSRITVISDCELPIGPKSERKVLAIELSDEPAVAATMDKLMGAEKDARRSEFAGHTIWEMVEPQSDVPVLQVETPGETTIQPAENDGGQKNDRDGRLLAAKVICVANGHLFVASHRALLEKVLGEAANNQSLATADDFHLIASQADTLGISPLSFRFFSRTDQEFRATYELVREGLMPQSETALGKLLNSVLGEGAGGAPRKQKIDGHTLPEFEAVQRYLGPAGTFVTSLDDGWMCTGVMLARQPLVAGDQAKTGIGQAPNGDGVTR
ncbi:MAG TPA: hypothetical protein VGJ15_00185 [Pirellulales bacterium]